MKLRLHRDALADNYTLGKISVDGDFLCYTCEDTDRFLEDGGEKIYGRTAIPRGIYKVILSWSWRFDKLLPELLDVPGFSGIRIHGGNTADDTLGCILVGIRRTADGVAGSAGVKQHLMDLIADAEGRGENVWITID